MSMSIEESVSWMKMMCRFGKEQKLGLLESATSDSDPSPGSPPATIISSIASHQTLPSTDTELESIQRPVQAHLRGVRHVTTLNGGYHASRGSLNECCAPREKAARSKRRMGLSKTKRILVLLAIDTAFFLLELIVGYAVHSLALVADAFHMLNDVLSLCVGLWAVRVANSGSSKMFTYGWQRAETLGALVNGVFLVALCLSIFLEAIQRFVEPQVVSNPKLVMIVGFFGLASNIFGLFLFHEHGHGHSHDEEGEGHSHSHDPISNAEEGHGHGHKHSHDAETSRITDEAGNMEDGGFRSAARDGARSPEFTRSDESEPTIKSPRTPARKSIATNSEMHGRHRRRTSGSHSRGFGSVDNIHIHPASFRDGIIQAARQEQIVESEPDDEEEALLEVDGPGDAPDRHTYHSFSSGSPKKSNSHAGYGAIRKRSTDDYDHTTHNHTQPKESSSGGHGHSHGDLNMRGVFLHVMGDALGNIGVIGSALFIWLTDFSWRYYVDPGVSLIITVIILTSAIPLCKAASRILLQAVPVGLSIDEIKEDIEKLNRVIEAHHLHVWQLSDTKLVASLHVKVDCEVEGTGSASYMHLAREIRHCLHEYGIHSSTIQPEFCSATIDTDKSPTSAVGSSTLGPENGGKGSKSASLKSDDRACLLDCQDDCGPKGQCCPPPDVGKK